MSNNWVELNEDSIPEPNILVWVERTQGNIYLASREDKPLATNPDASRDCYWYGNPLEHALTTNSRMELHAANHFSDVTVKRWHHVQAPTK